MRRMALRALAAAFALALAIPAVVSAQEGTVSPNPVPGPAQLASILAPIALYPDPLLASILTASTYPLELVEAARWVADPGNAGLTGDQLLAALRQKDWDPSVKSLVPFPQILKLMDDQLDWTQQLGNAFLAEQAQVMDTVQQLRRQAQAASALASTPQQVVTNNAGSVEIEPGIPDQVAVPSYDPSVVYGNWPYPDNPPAAFAANDPGEDAAGYPDGWYFAPPIVLVTPVWFWGRFDWPLHQIAIDRERFGTLNPFRPYVASTTWQHDPAHRRGVAYRDAGVQQRFPMAGRVAAPRPLPTVFTGIPETATQQPQQQQQYAPPNSAPRPPVAANRPPPSQQAAPATVPRPAQAVPARPATPVQRPVVPGQYRAPPVQARPVVRTVYTAPPRPMGGVVARGRP